MKRENARRIMVVDDDPGVLDMLSKLLKEWGYEPLSFRQFESARASLVESVPDAVVVDIRLGEYNGLQLIHLAKQIRPGIPVVAVSGFDDPVLRAEAAEAGAAYLLKPVELLTLRDHLPAAGR
jgi:DNA-binding NtrC family response regulator